MAVGEVLDSQDSKSQLLVVHDYGYTDNYQLSNAKL